MTKNIGTTDKAVRIIAALSIGILLLTGTLEGTLGIALGLLGVMFLLTSTLGICPLYLPFKISTCNKSVAG